MLCTDTAIIEMIWKHNNLCFLHFETNVSISCYNKNKTDKSSFWIFQFNEL